MYTKVLVPLDGSTFAEHALPMALELSRRSRAGVHVVTVLEPVTSFAYEGWESAAKEWSTKYVASVVERIADKAGGPVTHAVLEGHTVDRLLAEAQAAPTDITVMATHGRGALSRAWLGSVADGFVRHSKNPVILIRPEEEGDCDLDAAPSVRTILVPIDGSEVSESALMYAVEVGDLFQAAFHVTRVVPLPLEVPAPMGSGLAGAEEAAEIGRAAAVDYVEECADRLRRRGYQVTTSVTLDLQPARGILSEAHAVGADLIAMATHGRSGLPRLVIGSTTDKVLRGAHGPLLLYRAPEGLD